MLVPHPRTDTKIYFDKDEDMTEQSHKQACNVNCIMAKYQKTGVIDHIKIHGPQYMDVPAIDYREAMEIVANSNSMFEELPSRARLHFDNSPEKFLEYVQDPNNDHEKLHELGLLQPGYVKPAKTADAPENTSQGSSKAATSKSGSDSDAKASKKE